MEEFDPDHKNCEVCGKNIVERHHIIFRSQGGLDFPLNYKYLCLEHHKENKGPHRNKKINLAYKLELQDKLKNLLCKDFYSRKEIIDMLELNRTQAYKICRKFPRYKEGYAREDIIRRLMGGRIYG